MAKNALVKKLIAKFDSTSITSEDNVLFIQNSSDCCGLSELCGLDQITRSSSTEKVYLSFLKYLDKQANYNSWDGQLPSGLIFCTSTTGRKPQLEALGFKLVRRPFRNPKTGNQIHMYQILSKDLVPDEYIDKGDGI